MQYEIKSFDVKTGSALVRFWTEEYSDGLFYNVDIPIVSGKYIIGDQLTEHIMSFAPWGQIERLVSTASADGSGILSLIAPPPTTPAKTNEQLAAEARSAAIKQRTEYVSNIKVQTTSGNWFDGDEVSQGRMSRAIIALQATGTPTVTWVLADNSVIQASAAELTEALALAGAAQAAVWVIS